MTFNTAKRTLLAGLTCLFAAACGAPSAQDIMNAGLQPLSDPQRTLTIYDDNGQMLFKENAPPTADLVSSPTFYITGASNKIYGAHINNGILQSLYYNASNPVSAEKIEIIEAAAPYIVTVYATNGQTILQKRFSEISNYGSSCMRVTLKTPDNTTLEDTKICGLQTIASKNADSFVAPAQNQAPTYNTTPTAVPVVRQP